MNIAVIGAQWGDEGKGKVVDLLTPNVSIVARYQGGHNAGHTVRVGETEFILHLLPSGILHPGVRCVIGNGVVIDPVALFSEIETLAGQGIDVGDRLLISDRAHVILPYHRDLEAGLFRKRRLGDTRPGARAHDLGGGEEAVVLTARVRFRKPEAPGELAASAIPRRFATRIESHCGWRPRSHRCPHSRERNHAIALIRGPPRFADSVARDPSARSCRIEQAARLFGHLGCQIEAVRHRDRGGQSGGGTSRSGS